MQGKLANEQYLAIKVFYRHIHYTVVIVEDPEIDDLSGQPTDVLFSICIFDSQ
jgi:hypothetical protein